MKRIEVDQLAEIVIRWIRTPIYSRGNQQNMSKVKRQQPTFTPTIGSEKFETMAKSEKGRVFEVACPDCSAMLRIDAETGALISHTPAPRKRTFEDLATAAQAMRDQDDRKESIFRQSIEAEKNKEDLFEKKFAEALKKAKDAPAGKPLREFDLD